MGFERHARVPQYHWRLEGGSWEEQAGGTPGFDPHQLSRDHRTKNGYVRCAYERTSTADCGNYGIWGQHGQERSVLTVFENGKAAVLPYMGVPTRLSASSIADVLTISGEVAGRPISLKRTYELSPGGQTLTVHSLTSNNGKEAESVIVFLKQPDAAAGPLRAPEDTAEKRFKNVKTALKDLPASEFIDTMHYFAWSLGKNCEFCHVQHKMDVDDKKEKKTARKMIEMVASIDAEHFKNHPAVRCFTCHEGHEHPLTHPLFADEAAAAQASKPAQH
jgi:hypothetical protein